MPKTTKKPTSAVKPAPRTVKGIQAATGLDPVSAAEILAHERGEGDVKIIRTPKKRG